MALCVFKFWSSQATDSFPFNFEHPSCANVPMQTLPPCKISWVDYGVNNSNCFSCFQMPQAASAEPCWSRAILDTAKDLVSLEKRPPGRFDGTKGCVLEPVGRNPPFGNATGLASADHVCNLHASCLIIEVCLYIHRVIATSTSFLSNETAKQLRLVVFLPVPPEFLGPHYPSLPL